ncbi:MAG: hypothetical protein K1X64_03145 [Myxococcaceae bacterium]|nr:hypothetical protein [Myxococcaceae bacterium]
MFSTALVAAVLAVLLTLFGSTIRRLFGAPQEALGGLNEVPRSERRKP